MRTRRLSLVFVFFIAALLVCLPFAVKSETPAFADPYVTVTQDENGYYYGAEITPYATLQDLVDYAEENANDLVFLQFSSVTSDAPVSFSGTVAIGGNLAFL